MQICTATIALGGDLNNVMHRGVYNPISWPEIEVIRYIHSDAAVQDIVPIADVQQTGKAERARLNMIYGEGPLQALWGGRNSPGELSGPKAKFKDGIDFLNPVTGQMEKTSAKSAKVEEETGDEDDETEPETPETSETDLFGGEEERTAPAKKPITKKR